MDWDEVKNEFETTDISLVDLAAKYDIKYPTIKSRKQRQKWTKKDASQNASKDASESKKDASKKKHGGQPGNKNAKGHGAPQRNSNAVKHGLFARYLPEEIFEITKQLENMSKLDILWGNIELQSAKIIFSQPIMHVSDKNDLTKELKSESETSVTYELQYAWDKQAKSLVAQSRAMKTLTDMIKQYDELCKSDLATEEQKLRIDKLKLDIAGKTEQEESDGNINQLFNSLTQARKDLGL